MDAQANEIKKEEFRLSSEQQAEIGDILLSARAVSRQMIAQAQEQADKLLQDARDEAERLVREAEEKAEETLRAAEEQAAETIRLAEERAAEAVPAVEPIPDAEPVEAEPPVISEDMQEYVVRCVGDCFARLRQQQQETTDFINEQWRAFLSGLSLPELPTPGESRAAPAESEVSRQEIEERVSAIAKELMEIIAK